MEGVDLLLCQTVDELLDIGLRKKIAGGVQHHSAPLETGSVLYFAGADRPYRPGQISSLLSPYRRRQELHQAHHGIEEARLGFCLEGDLFCGDPKQVGLFAQFPVEPEEKGVCSGLRCFFEGEAGVEGELFLKIVDGVLGEGRF
jgi:hypothetical protein